MKRVPWVLVVLASLVVGSGCATSPKADPWEKMNRNIFAFNEAVDQYALAPVATAWDFVIPGFVQKGIGNLFDHANRPIILVHNLLQGKPARASVDLLRFVANSIFGFAGLVDVASMEGVPENNENWGQTLGTWGIASGPYLMLPFFGPSTPRSAFGLAADTFGAPHSYFVPFWASATITGTRLINTRAKFLEEIDQSRQDAFDYYLFVRDAYLQNLEREMTDGVGPSPEDEDDLYYYDYDEDDYDDDD